MIYIGSKGAGSNSGFKQKGKKESIKTTLKQTANSFSINMRFRSCGESTSHFVHPRDQTKTVRMLYQGQDVQDSRSVNIRRILIDRCFETFAQNNSLITYQDMHISQLSSAAILQNMEKAIWVLLDQRKHESGRNKMSGARIRTFLG